MRFLRPLLTISVEKIESLAPMKNIEMTSSCLLSADPRAQGTTSIRAIPAELNARGILTPRGGAWHPTSVARLLSRLGA